MFYSYENCGVVLLRFYYKYNLNCRDNRYDIMFYRITNRLGMFKDTEKLLNIKLDLCYQ